MLYPDFNELVAYKLRKSHVQDRTSSVKSIVQGGHHSPFRGQGLEFDSVREYVPGDEIRRIDWRVTARTGAPHIKLFKEDRERPVLICVDMNAEMRFGTRNTFKSVQAARIAAILGWQGIARQDRVSACLYGDVSGGIQYFAPKRTRRSFCAMLKTLSEPPAGQHEISLKNVVQQISQTAQNGSLIYIISDFINLADDGELELLLSRLNKRCDIVFIAVNDPADQKIPAAGQIAFVQNGKAKSVIDTESKAGREAYARQWLENRQIFHGLARKAQVPTIELSTQSEVYRDLMQGMKSIAMRQRK